ncbi:MAG: DoxX family protein [Tateyamaria sp.]|uniref:DoxX family protein n=1 Tax=Roseobacteraceae TaxID=2854170 RepID=UPI00329A37EA
MKKYALITAKVLLTLAFVTAGFFKLTGHDMMVATFDGVGIGQWFRYVTGLIEIGGAVLIWVPGLQFIGAGLLACTMAGAVVTHLVLIGGSALPAFVLGVLALYTLVSHRDQSPIG